VSLVGVVATRCPSVKEHCQPTIVLVGEQPQIFSLIAFGDTCGRLNLSPAYLHLYDRISSEIVTPARIAVAATIRRDHH
jgi:hypothetical protein